MNWLKRLFGGGDVETPAPRGKTGGSNANRGNGGAAPFELHAVLAFVISDEWQGEPVIPASTIDNFLDQNGAFGRHLARQGEFKIKVIPEADEAMLNQSIAAVLAKLYPDKKHSIIVVDCSSKPEYRARKWLYAMVEKTEKEGAPGSLHQPDPGTPVPFENEQFFLAYKETRGSLMNEYLRKGDTLEQWIKMIAVRQWEDQRDVKFVIESYLQQIRPVFLDEPVFFRQNEGKQDFALEVCLGAPDIAYVEYNLFRFAPAEDGRGIKSYQFAQRLPVSMNLNEFRGRQQDRKRAFLELRLSVLR